MSELVDAISLDGLWCCLSSSMEVSAEADEASFGLSRDQALVFFEWLARTRAADQPVEFEDQAEQRVLWDLEAALEAVLVEPFHADYRAELEAARVRVRDPEG